VHRFDFQELVESLIQINPPRARGVAYGLLESATACVLTFPTSFMACR
jgi:hypothetical protein